MGFAVESGCSESVVVDFEEAVGRKVRCCICLRAVCV